MFDKRWTNADAELSVHRVDSEDEPPTLEAAALLFMAILMASFVWTLLGLTLYGAALFSISGGYAAVPAALQQRNSSNDEAAASCGRCMWQYSVTRVGIVLVSAVCAATFTACVIIAKEDEEADHALRLARMLMRPCRTDAKIWIPIGIALLLFVLGWCAATFAPTSSELYRCASAVSVASPALCWAVGIFMYCDSALLLTGASFGFAGMAMRTWRATRRSQEEEDDENPS